MQMHCHHPECVRMSSVNLTIRTSNDLRPTRTSMPVWAKEGTRTTREQQSPFLTRRVANCGWHPMAYMSGVCDMIKGSRVKNGWHQSVSGAVGAMWRHLRVASAKFSRVVGAVGTYLSMSLSGCPEVANIVRTGVLPDGDMSESVESTPLSQACTHGAMRRYVGFVSQEKDEYEDAGPNMERGRACWGRIVPAGSDSPGRMWIASDCDRSCR